MFAGGIWEEDILVAETQELKKLDASEIYRRRLNAKEVLLAQEDENLCFLRHMVQQNCQEETEFQEPTLRRESTVRRENISGESHGDGEEFQLEETKDDEGINKDYWAHAEARKEFHLSTSH